MEAYTNLYNESILVFIDYGPTGERLIGRGSQIANMLKAPLFILTIEPKPFEELDAETIFYIDQWKKFAETHPSAQFIMKENEKRPVVKVISEVARQKQITQIILGQTAQSRWEQITKGSIINALLTEIPFVDLHIVSVSRYIRDKEGLFENGIRAYIVRSGKEYQLTFKRTKDIDYEGIFFKETGTDYNNGIFRFMKDWETWHVQVTNGIVKELKNLNLHSDK